MNKKAKIPNEAGPMGVTGPRGVQGADSPAAPVLGKVLEAPVLHHCPDCMAILLVLSREDLPPDVRLQFVKHVT